MQQQIGLNDAVLMLSLIYSISDISEEWELFKTCSRPIHVWLLGSYACVFVFRLVSILGDYSKNKSDTERTTNSTEFLLDLRQKSGAGRVLAAFTWLVILPIFIVWTVVGTSWLNDVRHKSPYCVPSTNHAWYAACWLILCYIWIVIHLGIAFVAWRLELRLRRAEHNLSAIEDDDVRSRWGGVSNLSNYTALSPMGSPNVGLTAVEIQALPGFVFHPEEHDLDAGNLECAICIGDFHAGDGLRRLPGCNHTFHRSCIDLWLLRRADCPLCKCCVKGGV